MALTIRPAAKSDDHALQPRRLRPSDDRRVLVAEYGKALVGAIAFGPDLFESVELGVPAARIERAMCWSGHRGAFEDLIGAALDALREEDIKFVSYSVSETERRALDAAQHHGFSVIECQLTLVRPIDADASAEMPDGIAAASPEDAEACAEIAATAFKYDRYHVDPGILEAAANGLAATAARNALSGGADTVLVARDTEDEDKRIVGFIACRLNDTEATIDQIAVAPDVQGKGWGKALVNGDLAHYSGKAARMSVATQSRNIASLAVFQECGFRIARSALTYHAHL